jgi:MFS family permease
MLSDFTHEGARSIYGTYLGLIGVSAFLISFVSGLGEFISQSLRVFTGIIADKTKKYWLMMILGYTLNLLAIPFLMFVDASVWQVAILLILLERIGKGIRAPAKSALTSFTTAKIGVGKAFALQEAMDQLGAFLGPLFVFIILSINKGSELSGYQLSFGLLGIFAIITLVLLVIAKFKYPNPDQFETKTVERGFKGNAAFLWYMVAVCFIALGFIDFPLLAYHIWTTSSIDVIYVPLIYSAAMGIDALSALFFGYIYDKIGIKTLMISTLFSLAFAPVFFIIKGISAVIIGIVIWGIAMGALESVLKAVIASVISKEKRATAYGIFYSVFGASWFLGSTVVGWLYGFSLPALVIFTAICESIAIVLLFVFQKKSKAALI